LSQQDVRSLFYPCFVYLLAAHRDLHSFPTRRSSDLLLAGTLGGLLTTWVTFVPCFLWILLGAPFMETMRNNKALSAALGAITAADRKSTRLNSSHVKISYAVFCLKKKST